MPFMTDTSQVPNAEALIRELVGDPEEFMPVHELNELLHKIAPQERPLAPEDIREAAAAFERALLLVAKVLEERGNERAHGLVNVLSMAFNGFEIALANHSNPQLLQEMALRVANSGPEEN